MLSSCLPVGGKKECLYFRPALEEEHYALDVLMCTLKTAGTAED